MTGGHNLYTLDVGGGRPALFLFDGEAPAWSPDGSRLAFSRTVEGNTDVYSVSANGTDLQRLTTGEGVDTDPWWGPDGTRITFASDRDGDFDVYTMIPMIRTSERSPTPPWTSGTRGSRGRGGTSVTTRGR